MSRPRASNQGATPLKCEEPLNQRVLPMVGPEGRAPSLVYRLADELERTPILSWRKAKAFLSAAQDEVGDD